MIAVLDYGIGNLRSAEKALVHLGADARLVTERSGAKGASGVVLPGVGAFGACATALRSSGLDAVVFDALEARTPVLGVCVGFQMLFDGSDESPGVPGLGVLEGALRLLPATVKRPQMQWNTVERVPGRPSQMLAPFSEPAWFYFVHSYAAHPAEQAAEAVVATCDYGGPVVAAVERGALWGTQFHPEKSGRAGLELLATFVAACAC